jgi:hypothetical protein
MEAPDVTNLKRSLESEPEAKIKRTKRKYTPRAKICDLPYFPLEVWELIVKQAGDVKDQIRLLLKLGTLGRNVLFSLRGADPFWENWWKKTFMFMFPHVFDLYRYLVHMNKLYSNLKNDWLKPRNEQCTLGTFWAKLVDQALPVSDLMATASWYEIIAMTVQLQQILDKPSFSDPNHSHHTSIVFAKTSEKMSVHYFKSKRFQSNGLKNLAYYKSTQEPIRETNDPDQFGKYRLNPYLINETALDPSMSEFLLMDDGSKNQYQLLYSASNPGRLLAILPDYCQWPLLRDQNSKDWNTCRARARTSLCNESLDRCHGIIPKIQVAVIDDGHECTEKDKGHYNFGDLDDLNQGFLKTKKGSLSDPKPFAHLVSLKKENGIKPEFISGIVYSAPEGRERKRTKTDISSLILPSTIKSLDTKLSKKAICDFLPRMLEALSVGQIGSPCEREDFSEWVITNFNSHSGFFSIYPDPEYAKAVDISIKPFITRFHNELGRICRNLTPKRPGLISITHPSPRKDMPSLVLLDNHGSVIDVLRSKLSKDSKCALRYDALEYHHCYASRIHSEVVYGHSAQVFPSEIESRTSHYFETINQWREWKEIEFPLFTNPFPPEDWLNLPSKSVRMDNGTPRTIDDALSDMQKLYGNVTKDLACRDKDYVGSELDEIIAKEEEDYEIIIVD